MLTKHETFSAALLELVAGANAAAKAIPPLFPLSSSVAVNPFLGQTTEPLAMTAARLARVAGTRITPDRAIHAEKFSAGTIIPQDVQDAITGLPPLFEQPTMDEVMRALHTQPAPSKALPTVAELAADASGIDWPGLIEDRIGAWAASHFDQGQALWQPGRNGSTFAAWREFAIRDLTPEIHGLAGFGAFVATTNRSHWRAIGRACETLGVTPASANTAFHRWLMTLGGWAQYARYLLWQAELVDQTDDRVTALLAIRMVFDEALYNLYKDQIADGWAVVTAQHATPITPTRDHLIDAIWQDAAERAQQRALAQSLTTGQPRTAQGRPRLQAAFCIDVRSEVFRRALETQDAGIETIGFAGFFGLASAHKELGSDVTEVRGPVLLRAGLTSQAETTARADLGHRYAARAQRAWGRFKLAAVSSFAFVEATGPMYVGKLLHDTFAMGHRPPPDPKPQLDPAIDIAARTDMAKTVLNAMSFTKNFGRIVMLTGHGADVTNNPHHSALHCGACGGYAGDVNARLLAGILNDADVQAELRKDGIDIPADCVFLPALHNTTTDTVTLYEQDIPAGNWSADIAQLRQWLDAAGRLAREECAQRLPRARKADSIARRANDWAELRPEWGLAGCSAFVAAPRHRTEAADLAGHAFLHSYDWHADDGFKVLELIMTAPVVVASWISL